MGMTRDEALKVWLPIIQMGVEAMPECKKALDMAIKALEQEPIKPMVEIDLYSVIKQKYIEREVLDKIRAEIEDLTYYWCEVHPRSVIDDVLAIIDKYKAEGSKEA